MSTPAWVEELWNRAWKRTPRGGLVGVTMAELELIHGDLSFMHCCPLPWDPPTLLNGKLFGVDVIVIDRPPLPVPPVKPEAA